MKKKLGDILREAGVIDQNQLRTALSHQKRWGGRLGEILVILNFLIRRQTTESPQHSPESPGCRTFQGKGIP
jgi:hypothetical protein